jgi:hypothetical protein
MESLIGEEEDLIRGFRMAIIVAMDYKGTVLEDHLNHMARQVKEVAREDLLIYIVFPVKDRNTTLLSKVININTQLNDIKFSVTDSIVSIRGHQPFFGDRQLTEA